MPGVLRRLRRGTWFWVALACVIVIPFALWSARDWYSPGDVTVYQRSIAINGLNREYRLVIPDSIRSASLPPVVFALHGALDTTEQMAAYSDLDRLAAEHGFLLVYLQGRHLSWPPMIPPENPDAITPDIRFFEALCDEMVETYHADPERVYVVGVSQGGAMANLLTVKCSQRIAATVCVCGWLPDPLGSEPLGTHNKCPVLFVVGSEDTQVSPETVRSVQAVFAENGHPVEFRLVEGAGHGWPQATGINEEIWKFLSARQQPGAVGVENGE